MTFRILHVFDHSLPLHSGYTFRSAAILREQRKRGWETHQLTSPKHDAPFQPNEQVDDLLFHRTPPATGVDLPVVREWAQMQATERRLLEVAQAVRPDILHAHSPVLNALPAIAVGRRLGIPVVYEIRAFWEDAAVDHGTTTEGSLRYRASRAMETRALRQVAHAFTICEGLRADIVARGIPEHKVTVIPNAVDIGAFELGGQPDEALKDRLGLRGCTVIGFIGSFYAYEGLDLLVRALEVLRPRMPFARLLLVGGGPQEQALRRQVQDAGLSDAVVFTGRVPHAEVKSYYDLVDVLAYPRHRMRLTDLVTPLKPLEAMAQGRVMVASDVGGHRELIEHGRTGMLFPAGDHEALAGALLDLVTRRNQWDALRCAGRAFVETQRHWAASVARYEKPYGQIVRRAAAA